MPWLSQCLNTRRLLIITSLKNNTKYMEKIPNQNKEKSGENLENEFKINQEMEIQADILGINLEKLKAEINAMGGVEKFRELANKGLQEYKDEQGETRYYETEGEKIFQGMASCLRDLRNFFAE